MNKNIKKIAAVLTAGLILTGCNKNTAINANKSEAESPIDTKEIIQAAEWNNEVIDKTIGENEEKIIIKAKVNILSDDIYEGSIKKEFPTVEMIEKELCDGKLTGYPDDVIDKITLCYMENEENNVIPVWAFSIYWGDMDNVVYVYDAVNGNLIIN